MVTTRQRGNLPPLSPQARHTTGTRRASTTTVAAASAATSRRTRTSASSAASSRRSDQGSSANSSIESEPESEPEPDSEDDEDDVPPQELKFEPPPPARKFASARISSASVSSSGSKREKLDLSIEKQVLKDIEEKGGLYLFEVGVNQALSQLLDNPTRSRLYGGRGDPVRAKIARRVRYLKKLPRLQYNTLLTKYRIEAAKLSKKDIELIDKNRPESIGSPRPVKTIETEQEKKEDLSDLEDEDNGSAHPDAAFSRSVHKSSINPERSVSSKHSIKPVAVSSRSSVKPEPFVSSGASRISRSSRNSITTSSINQKLSSTMTGEYDKYVDIWLDPEQPFLNPEGIMLAPFTGFEYSGSQYEGLTIILQGDPRDVSADAFKLEVFDPPGRPDNQELAKPTNMFKLTMPLVPAGLWQDRDELVADEEIPTAVKNGIIVTMQAVKDLPNGDNKKEFVIGIKNGSRMKLTDKPFIPGDEPGDSLRIKPFHPVSFYETGHAGDDGDILNMGTYVCWRLCDMSTKRKMQDDEEKGPAGQSGVAAALARRKKARQADSTTGSQHAATKQRSTTKPSPVTQTSGSKMEIDKQDDIEDEMLANMKNSTEKDPENEAHTSGARDLDPYKFEISQEGWDSIRPLIMKHINSYGGDLHEIYNVSRLNAIQRYVDEDLGEYGSSIEEILIDYVRGEVWKGQGYNEVLSQSKTSTLNRAVVEENRKHLFKPLASSARDVRDTITEKSRQNRRQEAVNKARNSNNPTLAMESLLHESINDAQGVLDETSGDAQIGPKESYDEEY